MAAGKGSHSEGGRGGGRAQGGLAGEGGCDRGTICPESPIQEDAHQATSDGQDCEEVEPEGESGLDELVKTSVGGVDEEVSQAKGRVSDSSLPGHDDQDDLAALEAKPLSTVPEEVSVWRSGISEIADAIRARTQVAQTADYGGGTPIVRGGAEGLLTVVLGHARVLHKCTKAHSLDNTHRVTISR
ncbi:unnamed protein product [Phytophthora fragariaefolia]|uniref:Unnamed protein product n=1 Tax=Phytophthora fragariaefolia TaxID=1490495 RepID=A0A9W6YAC4_9STRA|nr:unnamed protein product [Phytophthora fragariaefolia]